MKANIEEIKKKAVPILKKAGVSRSAVFGSYIRGEARDNSDIDMLVEVPRGTGLFAFVGLQYIRSFGIGFRENKSLLYDCCLGYDLK